MSQDVYYSPEGNRRRTLMLDIEKGRDFFGQDHEVLDYARQQLKAFMGTSKVQGPTSTGTGTRPLWPARLMTVEEVQAQVEEPLAQGEVVVILLCYDNHHCFCSVKSTDCRRVTVDELKIMIQRQQEQKQMDSKARNELWGRIGRPAHGAQLTPAWLSGMAYALKFAELSTTMVPVDTPCENDYMVDTFTAQQLEDPWGEGIPSSSEIPPPEGCELCSPAKCLGANCLALGLHHLQKDGYIMKGTVLYSTGEKRRASSDGSDGGGGDEGRSSGQASKRRRKSGSSITMRNRDGNSNTNGGGGGGGSVQPMDVSPSSPCGTSSGASSPMFQLEEQDTVTIGCAVDTHLSGPSTTDPIPPQSTLSSSQAAATPTPDDSKGTAASEVTISFHEAFHRLAEHAGLVSAPPSIMFTMALGLEDQLMSRVEANSLNIKDLEVFHREVLEAILQCKAARDQAGKVLDDKALALKKRLVDEVNKLHWSTEVEDEETETEVLNRMKEEYEEKTGGKIVEDVVIEEEIKASHARQEGLENDIKKFQELALVSMEAQEVSRGAVDKLHSNLTTEQGRREQLRQQLESLRVIRGMAEVVGTIQAARKEVEDYHKTTQDGVRQALVSWSRLRFELYERRAGGSNKTLLLYDPGCIRHPGNDIERPERMEEVVVGFREVISQDATGQFVLRAEIDRQKYLPVYSPVSGSTKKVKYTSEIRRVHGEEYLERLRLRCDSAGSQGSRMSAATDRSNKADRQEGDTIVGADSFSAAAIGFAAALQAVDAVMSGQVRSAFVACRPPGHHSGYNGVPSSPYAKSDSLGFCLLNYVAGAAKHAVQEWNLKRVTVVDWDLHHGNGTEEILCSSHSTFYQYISVHAYGRDVFPKTGSARTNREPYVVNIPISSRVTSTAFHKAFHKIATAIDSFEPDLILVSAGFDAHRNDPLTGCRGSEYKESQLGDLQASDYYEYAKRLQALADRHCMGRILVLMEGGYCCGPLGLERVRASPEGADESQESLKDCIISTCRAMAEARR